MIILICHNKVNSNLIRGLQSKPLTAPTYGYNQESRSLRDLNQQENIDLDHA